eukprot:gene9003-biopygen9168
MTEFLKEMAKMSFVVTTLGLSDLLRQVKDLSLFQQTVNTLPWEVAEQEHHFHVVQMNTALTEQLHNCELTEEGFPLRFKHQAELMQNLMQKKYLGAELTVAPIFAGNGKAAFKSLLKDLTKWSDLARAYFIERFVHHEQIVWMGKCLDLRNLCMSPCALPDEYMHLRMLHTWAVEKGKLCALKIQNEAVVEGMGSTVDRHATAVRGLKQEKYAKESFIEYNGPESSEADGFLTAALNLHFKAKPWHFQHVDKRGRGKHLGMSDSWIKILAGNLFALRRPWDLIQKPLNWDPILDNKGLESPRPYTLCPLDCFVNYSSTCSIRKA